MNTDTDLINKYENYILELKEANEQQEHVIQSQIKLIETQDELIAQQNEKIELLTKELKDTISAAKEMAKMVDSILGNK